MKSVKALWGADLRVLACRSCGVAHLLPDDWSAPPTCPACLAETLEPQPERLHPGPPTKVVSFSAALTPDHLSRGLHAWLRGLWLRPADLRVSRLLERMRRVYLPMWLVDGRVVGTWQAQVGFDYQVESTRERYQDDAGWAVQRLNETQVRWEPRVGQLERHYQGLPLPALEKREQAVLMDLLGPFDLEQSTAYTPARLADAAARLPSLPPDDAWPLARAALDSAAASDCQQAAGAQHHQEFQLEAAYHDLNWSQLLLPCYVTYYEDDVGRRVSVWVNGQSGHIGGARRASLRRAWYVSGALGAAAALCLLLGGLLALLSVQALPALALLLGLALLFVAVLPVLWAWQFNRT